MDDKQMFLDGQNVVVFEHFMVDRELSKKIKESIADPLDQELRADGEKKLKQLRPYMKIYQRTKIEPEENLQISVK